VEDTQDMREFLSGNLSIAYTVHTASNGKEAIDPYLEKPFALNYLKAIINNLSFFFFTDHDMQP
jgi:DNA-binding response OmpR family regulator